MSTLLSSSRERSGCALEALASGAGAPRRLQGLLSWLFSQSRPSRPCPVFLFSYLREEKGGFRESPAQIAGHEGGEGLPGTCPPPAAGLPAPPRRRPGRTLRMHRDYPVLGKARAGAGTGPLPGLTEMLLDSIQDVHAVLAVHHVHGQAPLAKAAGAPDPVQVGLVVWVPVLVHGEVKVDDDRHLFHVDPCVRRVGHE